MNNLRTDLSLDFDFDPEEEPLSMVEAAMRYKNDVSVLN